MAPVGDPKILIETTHRITGAVLKRRLRPVLLGGILTLIIIQIVALSPASIENTMDPPEKVIEPKALIPKAAVTLATGIPTDKIPEYMVDKFNYVSTENGVKQWNMVADKANLYNSLKLVHSRQVKAYLYDPDGKITTVTGLEAKYFMNQRDLEIFGNVKTVFPDGFELYSDYLRYKPKERKIEVPVRYPTRGQGKEDNGSVMSFASRGLDYDMAKATVLLPQSASLTMEKASTIPGKKPDSTTIESDTCVIHRNKQMAYFTMNQDRPLKERFVHIYQPAMIARGRTADLNYGDFSKVLRYLVIHQDVLIKEIPEDKAPEQEPHELKYATAGRADFDSKKDLIVLTEFPQVYQGNDTVTGDVILMHRDTDVVEVEHSNSFSDGAGG